MFFPLAISAKTSRLIIVEETVSVAISYTRFSSGGQRESSIDRQLEMAVKWCEINNHTLDRKYQFKDCGKSGFTGENVTEGALGELLRLQETGKLDHVDTVLVENFDRFSRQPPRLAFRHLEKI